MLGDVFSRDIDFNHFQISPAANKWQNDLYEELIRQGYQVLNISIINDAYWPRGKLFPYRKDYRANYGKIAPYINLLGLRNLSIFISKSIFLIQLIIKKRELPLFVVTYNHQYSASIISLLMSVFGIKWINICADAYNPNKYWTNFPILPKLAKANIFLSHWAYQNCPFGRQIFFWGGISKRQSSSSYPYPLTNQKIKIMYSGMLNQWGGITNFLEFVSKLHKSNYEIIITGHSRDAHFERILKKLDSKVRFYGLVSNKKLEKLMEETHVFINPRPNNVDGNDMNFPSKIIEYLSFEKPIISTKTLGIPDYFNGVLYSLDESSDSAYLNSIDRHLSYIETNYHQACLKVKKFNENSSITNTVSQLMEKLNEL